MPPHTHNFLISFITPARISTCKYTLTFIYRCFHTNFKPLHDCIHARKKKHIYNIIYTRAISAFPLHQNISIFLYIDIYNYIFKKRSRASNEINN